MRNKIFIKGAVALASIAVMASCSDSYLQTNPITEIAKPQVTQSVKTCRMGMRGIAYYMKSQYMNTNGGLFNNGEGTLQAFYGEGLGQDDFMYLQQARFSGAYLNLEYCAQPGYWAPSAPWGYLYAVITQANTVLAGIDGAEGDEKERNFIKAQLLTFRAYAYWRLLQFYAPRWEDAKGGEIKVVVRRDGTELNADAPLMTMNETFEMIYKDLDDAIGYFEAAPEVKRTDKIEPDLNVARGIYARTALIKHDWATAETMANKARTGYTIMDEAGYRDGFTNYDNEEWMWCSSKASDDSIYYWDNVAFYAANGAYIWYWAVMGAGAINIDLYRQMDEKDIRRALFLTPDKIPAMDEADWWSEDYINISNMSLMRSRLGRTPIRQFNAWLTDVTPAGFNLAYTAPKDETQEQEIVVPLGAHGKLFANNGDLGGSTLYMRAAEMLLIEAEAAAMQNKSTVAQNLLNELNSKRIPGYSCTKSGDDLINEVRLQRRIELWGEGHNWFDLKRWNLPIVRREWVAGDPTSGNIPQACAINVATTACHGWRFAVPDSESHYNAGFSRSELEY